VSQTRHARAVAIAGEHRLPGVRARFLSSRAILFYTIAAIALTLPIAAISSLVRGEPDSTAALIMDPRTIGQRAIDDAQARLERAPGDPHVITQLASAYLQRARETGDPTYYSKADGLLATALADLPADADVAIVEGSLALSRHDFVAALGWGTRAVALGPARPSAYGVLVDAEVELGRYDEAIANAQRMADMRPDLSSYTRISYLRELHGDLAGAIAAMQLAIQAGPVSGEATAWCDVQLGNLYFAKGDLDGAERAYTRSVQRVAGYAHGNAGIARVRAARGDVAAPATLYERVVAMLPLPEYVGALGDVYAREGNGDGAARQYALLDVERRLLIANGVRVDADLALFDADHQRDLARAVDVARAEYAIRPSVHIADILAWAEFRSGDIVGALHHSIEALRLGSQDPLLLYHAGVIAQESGDDARASALLQRAHDLSPSFSFLWADDLAGRLSGLVLRGSTR
jgi:tetratricopeptide (TPR) repeat protein